jgi:pimeloyl-ACP methyl ester carboxylesterase
MTEIKSPWPQEVGEIFYSSAADDSRQPALFYAPKTQQPRPLLVGLHQWGGDYLEADSLPYAEWCIRQGWAFIHPNFRGPNIRPEACGSVFVVGDILSAVKYAMEQANIDPSCIYLIGTSGDGHAGLLLAAMAPQVWAGVSVWVPISDLEAWYFESLSRIQKYARNMESVCVGRPDQNPEVRREYFERSPIHHLHLAKNLPLDVNAGIHDGWTGSVPVSQSLRAFNVLANEADQIPEAEILFFVDKAAVLPGLEADTKDPLYGSARILFRQTSAKARITIFDGGNDLIPEAGLNWLAEQRAGRVSNATYT